MMSQAPAHLGQAWEATLTVGAVSTRDGALPGSLAAADANPTCAPKLVLAVVRVGSAGGTQGRRGLERCLGTEAIRMMPWKKQGRSQEV